MKSKKKKKPVKKVKKKVGKPRKKVEKLKKKKVVKKVKKRPKIKKMEKPIEKGVEETKIETKLEETKKIDTKTQEEEIEEMTPEVIERLAEKVKAEAKEEEIKEGQKKEGFFGRLFRKKEKKTPEAEVPEIVPETKIPEIVPEKETTSPRPEVVARTGTDMGMELEKVRVTVESLRESKRATDERIQGLAENIGELRSMVFRADADIKEASAKMERMETEVSGIRPKEIEKRMSQINEKLQKHDMILEKTERTLKDLGVKINKTYNMLKEMGGVENLAELNLRIKEKINDIKELVKYIERLGSKVERISIDMGKNLEDFVVYKARVDDLDDTSKNVVKSIDGLNVKLGNFITKKDWEKLNENIIEMQKKIEEITKEVPVLKERVPETIKELRKEKKDIKLLLDSLREGYQKGNITKGEYKEIEKSNQEKIAEIESSLAEEWKKIRGVLSGKVKPEEGEKVEGRKVRKRERKPKKKEEKKKEVKEEDILKDILKGV